jgi:hypothetical protein
MDYIDIKIDRSTLPKDRQRVEFFIPGDSPEGIVPLIGVFCEGDDEFVPDDGSFHNSWKVHKWRSLEKEFNEWFSILKSLAVSDYGFSTAEDFDIDAWKEYWTDGLSPKEAIDQDISNV